MTARPADRIYAEPDRTGREPDVTELVLDWDRENDGGMHVVRLTLRDREGVLAALANPDGLLKWRQAARNVARGVPVLSARLAEEHADSVDALVTEAYAGGYALAVQDCLATSQTAEGVRDFLHGILQSGAAPGADWDHKDVEAIERVRALLES